MAVVNMTGSPEDMSERGQQSGHGPARKQCPQCGAFYTRMAHLNRHMKTRAQPSFLLQKMGLTSKKDIDLKERMHTCEICEAQFARNDVMKKHRKGCAQR